MTLPEAGESADRLVYAAGSPDHDYDPDHDAPDPFENNPIWQQDNVRLRSVGIDIGSSGTQVAFTRIHLRRLSEEFSSRYVVVERTPTYQSPVRFTPYLGAQLIDADELGAIIDDAYGAARQRPDDVETGVVLLTGEAARRRNAERIAGVLASRCGEFVCAAAGHHMEAMLAAYGSGAARASHEAGSRILNIDIGGGTTKLALIDNGRVAETAALHIGGRLQVIDADGRIARLEPAGHAHAERAGQSWSLGDVVTPEELDRVAETMVDALVTAVTVRPVPRELHELYLTEPINNLDGVAGVMFSGGVAEYVYERETHDYGDLGRRLGAGVRRRLDDGRLPFQLLPAGECIRATVLGASEFTVQLSGSTSYISNPDRLLPRRNLQVIRPDYVLSDEVDPDAVAAAIRRHLRPFDADRPGADVALALPWSGVPSYERVSAFAHGVEQAVADRASRGRPNYLILDGDIALSLGAILHDEFGLPGDLVALDGLSLWHFDYIDLGRIRHPSRTVPVTIKSLIFGQDPRAHAVASPDVEPHARRRQSGRESTEAQDGARAESLADPTDEGAADRGGAGHRHDKQRHRPAPHLGVSAQLDERRADGSKRDAGATEHEEKNEGHGHRR